MFIIFGPSNIKNEILTLENIPRIHVKYCAHARPPILPNYANFQQIYKNFKLFQNNVFLSYKSASYMKKHIFFMKNTIKQKLSKLVHF